MPARHPSTAVASVRIRSSVSQRARPGSIVTPVLVETLRGTIVEAQHRGHVVQVGADGSVEAALGDTEVRVPLRSCAKPFGLVAFVESGAADAFRVTPSELAIMASSHSGEDLHVRTIQSLLRRAGISQTLLGCGSEGAPIDELTAVRLTRDGERPGPIRHNCSGQHASLLMLSKHAGWPLEAYWKPDHPSQVVFRLALARAFGVAPESLTTAVDSCGLLTYQFPLVEVARAFALLADPVGVGVDVQRQSVAPALRRIRDAMLAAPELVGGMRDRLDTALMKAVPGGIVAKGGAEALCGVALLPGLRGGRGAAGLALKIEDGDAARRAAPVATVEALRQVGALGTEALRRLAPYQRLPSYDPRGVVVGETRPRFELAPVAELR